MVNAENVLICIAVPFAISFLFTKGSARRLISAFLAGMVDSDGNTSITGGKLLGFGTNNSEEGTQYSVSFNTNSYYGNSQIAFKPSFSGSKMVSNVGQPGTVNSVDGMQKQCFGSSTTNCVYYK